jgi:hypothetical protein
LEIALPGFSVWRHAGPVATLELPDGDGLHRVYPVCLVNNLLAVLIAASM